MKNNVFYPKIKVYELKKYLKFSALSAILIGIFFAISGNNAGYCFIAVTVFFAPFIYAVQKSRYGEIAFLENNIKLTTEGENTYLYYSYSQFDTVNYFLSGNIKLYTESDREVGTFSLKYFAPNEVREVLDELKKQGKRITINADLSNDNIKLKSKPIYPILEKICIIALLLMTINFQSIALENIVQTLGLICGIIYILIYRNKDEIKIENNCLTFFIEKFSQKEEENKCTIFFEKISKIKIDDEKNITVFDKSGKKDYIYSLEHFDDNTIKKIASCLSIKTVLEIDEKVAQKQDFVLWNMLYDFNKQAQSSQSSMSNNIIHTPSPKRRRNVFNTPVSNSNLEINKKVLKNNSPTGRKLEL